VAGQPGAAGPRATAGMLNAVGLQGPGVAAWMADDLPALLATGATVVASIWGRSIDDYRRAAEAMAAAPAGVVAVEVNLSCPNVEDRSGMFAHSPRPPRRRWPSPRRAAGRAGRSSAPTPATSCPIVDAAVRGGAEAVTLVNTVMGMAIDPAPTGLPPGQRGRGPVGAGDPPGGRPGRARRGRCPARGAHRGRGGRLGCGHRCGADRGGSIGRAGRHRDLRRPGRPRVVAADLADWCRHHGITELQELVGSVHAPPTST
jgi:dihydroorotate dehydrogenase (NAD+) catalytic subunit